MSVDWNSVWRALVCRGPWDDGDGWHVKFYSHGGRELGEEALEVEADATPAEALAEAQCEYFYDDFTVQLGDVDE